MAQKAFFMMSLLVSGSKRGEKTSLLQESAVSRDPMRAKRAALMKRLKAKADAAERGESVSLTGLSDDELIAVLKTR